jgi:hypothetical protein
MATKGIQPIIRRAGESAARGTLIELRGEMIADFYGGAELGWDSFRVADPEVGETGQYKGVGTNPTGELIAGCPQSAADQTFVRLFPCPLAVNIELLFSSPTGT